MPLERERIRGALETVRSLISSEENIPLIHINNKKWSKT